jgi:hypothetical protein
MSYRLLESCLLLNENKPVSKEVEYLPVYVLLTHTGTVLSNAIKKVTKNPYSHSSISFDSSLRSMYSFGRKYKNNPLIGVFVKENIRAGLYADVSDTATYSLYVTFVTASEKRAMEEKLSYFIDNSDRFRYNFTGLFKNSLGKESHREDAYFCSQFVDTILKASGRNHFDRHSSLVRPYDFAKHKDFLFVQKGKLSNYTPAVADMKVQKLKEKYSSIKKK